MVVVTIFGTVWCSGRIARHDSRKLMVEVRGSGRCIRVVGGGGSVIIGGLLGC